MSDISQTGKMPNSQSKLAKNQSGGPAFLFDFDGTLLDSDPADLLWHLDEKGGCHVDEVMACV